MTFATNGQFPCELTVSNAYGEDTSEFVVVVGEGPEITSVSPTGGESGTETVFSATVSGDEPLTYSWDFGNGASPNTSSDVSPAITFGAAGEYQASLTVSNVYGSDVFTFGLTVSGGEDPPEILSVEPTEGDSQTEVAFTATVTGTPPMMYAWVFGNGADPNVSNEAAPVVVLATGGSYSASLTVFNSFGSDTFVFTLTVKPVWRIQMVDSESELEASMSIALDCSGTPFISYVSHAGADFYLKLAHFDGLQWPIETIAKKAWKPSLAIDLSDCPHIGFTCTEWPLFYLKYAYNNGAEWEIQTIDTIDTDLFVGFSGVHLALDSQQHPHIGYYDNFNAKLKYAYYDGSSWHVQSVPAAENATQYNWLALDSADLPHFSYFDGGYGSISLKYVRYDGSQWYVDTVDSEEVFNGYNSLAIDNSDYPHISYVILRGLKYAYFDGTWHTEVVDSAEGNVGFYENSIALDSSGYPHISYNFLDKTYCLKYAWYDGSEWQIRLVDSEFGSGDYNSLALDSSDYPHIGYRSNYGLKYATYY